MSSSGSTSAKKRKNAAGNRSDPGWEHGTQVDNDTKKVRCKYCSVVRFGGIFRHKHHLAGTGCNVEACLQVSNDVKQKFKAILQSNEEQSSRKKKKLNDIGEEEECGEYQLGHNQWGKMDSLVYSKQG